MVTILILVDGFLQWNKLHTFFFFAGVTILILVDGFLQYQNNQKGTTYIGKSQSLF